MYLASPSLVRNFLLCKQAMLSYSHLRQDSDAGLLLLQPALTIFAKSKIPSFSGFIPRTVLADVQAKLEARGFCFMAKGNIGKKPWNWNGGRTVTQAGYVLIFVGKGHPIADCRGYAYEHRLKAYNAGHDIEGKHVHHEDEVKSNNDNGNLKPLTPAEHRFEHRKPGSNKRLPGEANPVISCACGCGGTFEKYDASNRPRKYISGHNSEVLHLPALCSCGCGNRMVRYNPDRVGMPQYLAGHRPAPPNPVVECACGCGLTLLLYDSTRRKRRYLSGHNLPGKGHSHAGN